MRVGRLLVLTAMLTMASSPVGAESATAPPGLITPAGVPVAVVESGVGGHWVTTPCGNLGLVTGGTPLRDIQVVLDPGHGGPIDTGAVGPNGLAEKDVNLRVASAAAELLNSQGIATVLTRTGDYATPLRVRANLADTLGAKVLVSIHHNAPIQAPSPVPGVEVFHENASEDSKRLGGLVYERAMTALSTFVVDWVAPADAGVMAVLNHGGRDAYGMIRLPQTTSILVELGYLANPAEAELYARPVYARVAASAIADGVLDYLLTDRPGSGYVAHRVFSPLPGVGRSLCEEVPLGGVAPAVTRY